MPAHRANRVGALTLTLGLVLGVAGTGIATQGFAGAAKAPATTYSITISNFMFMPMKLTVPPGAKIKVTNKDTTVHTLTAVNGSFSTGNLKHNESKTITAPKRKGTYRYLCSIHQFMVGKIIVK